MNYFWNFDNSYLNNVAVITESGASVTYRQLDIDIEEKSSELPNKPSLVFLSVGNNYESILWYLACLRAKHPLLLLDKSLDDELKENLFLNYLPNFHITNGAVCTVSHLQHDLHSDIALLMSTSGTTGSPKLVKLSKDNISANVVSICDYLSITAKDVAITTLPMSYSFGLSIIHSHLAVGATVVLNESSLTSKDFWAKVVKHEVSSISGVPFSFQMLKKLNYKRFNTTSIRYLAQAGGKLDNETTLYFNDVCKDLGQEFYVMYGQTEASPRISYVPFKRLENKIGSIGIPIPNGNLLVKSGDKLVSTPQLQGELVYQGLNVMMGYAKSSLDLRLGDTQKGLLYTGDWGYCDEEGYFYITGRVKRFIKLFGLRISLDAIDTWLTAQKIDAVSSGNDDRLVIFYSGNIDDELLKMKLSSEFKLNKNYVEFKFIKEIPRKNGGKVDFKHLNKLIEL